MKWLFSFLLLFCISCQSYLSVRQEIMNRDYLASVWVNTPDPRKKDPPKGQKLLVSWDYPYSIFRKKLYFKLMIKFWDHSEKVFTCPIERKRMTQEFLFPDIGKKEKQKILTYKIEVFDQDHQLVDQWVHQLWTGSIKVE